MGICTGCGAEVSGEHLCDMGAGRTPAEALALIAKIESHLSRIADAQESPFWRLMGAGQASLNYHEGIWIARHAAFDHGLGKFIAEAAITGTGPTPQAAVAAFNEAFKGGAGIDETDSK